MVGPADAQTPVNADLAIARNIQITVVNNTIEQVRGIFADINANRPPRPPQQIEGFPNQLPPLHFRSRELPPDQREFFRTPANASRITDAFDSNTRYDPSTRTFIIDEDRMRQQFNALLGSAFSNQEKIDMFDHVYRLFLGELYQNGRVVVREAEGRISAARTDSERREAVNARDIGLSAGAQSSEALATHGVGTTATNQKSFLESCGRDLNEDQRRDMIRAASASGMFNLSAIFAAADTLNVSNSMVASTQQENMQITFTNQLKELATTQINKWNNMLNDQQADREEQQRTRDMIRRYLGSSATETNPINAAAVKAQWLEARDLSNLVPRLVQ